MANEVTEPAPVKPRALVAVPGWMLFVCLFLPTLRVCGSPTLPLQFPPSYVIYLGAIFVAIGAATRALRTRRTMHTVWLTMWVATIAAILALSIGANMHPLAGVVVGVAALVGTVLIVQASLKLAWSPRALAIGWVVHGLLAVAWNVLLATDKDAMFGAFVALGASVLLAALSGAAVSSEAADERARRLATEPAPLPVARAIERDLT